MSSELVLDELTGRSSAGSIAVTAEGGTATTNLQGGLAKAWLTGSSAASGNVPTAVDSLNMSGLTDDTAGKMTMSFTNNFRANLGYTSGGNACDADDQTTFQYQTVPLQDGVVLTGSVQLVMLGVGASASFIADNAYFNSVSHGDLA
tara:strand:- start:815 stop:1255 length:441 start_codon:yes stop_codon:yes gene_type:complete